MIRLSLHIVFVINLLFCPLLFAQVIEPKFDTFRATIVHAFHQDSQGFIWIGTQEGLLRYDGYTYKHYNHTPFDSTSLSNDWIYDIEEDQLGNLWIATFGGGLCYFDQKTQKFNRFSGSAEKNQNSHITKIIVNEDGSIWFSGSMHSLTHLRLDLDKNPYYTHYDFSDGPVAKSFPSRNTAMTAYKDKRGEIWVGMATEGLIRFDPGSKEKKQYKHDPENAHSISHNTVSSLCEDDSGNIWLGTGHPNISRQGGGLNLFNRKTETFKHFKRDWSGKNSICSDNIGHLLIDHTGTMWIGSVNNYINTVPIEELLSGEEPIFRHYRNLKGSSITTLYEDRYGNVWIGLMNRESHKFDRQQNSFALFSRNDDYPNSLTQTGTWIVYADKSGKMWFGTNGVDIYDKKTGDFQHFYHDWKDTSGLSENMISGIQEDPDGNVWIATWHDGINILNPESGLFKHIRHNLDDSTGLGSNSIQYLLARTNGDFWIASQDVGIQLYEQKTGKFYTYDLNAETNEDFLFSNLCEDRKGTLWIGTFNNGMYSLRLNENQILEIFHYTNDPHNFSSLSCNDVTDIIQPSVTDTNALWIATKAGLNRFDLETKSFKHFFAEDGLAANLVLKILEDNQGNLWCATPHGISVYKIKSGKIISFGKGDGLPFDSFGGGRQNAAKDPDGHLYFAGGNGVLSFFPPNIHTNPNIPPIRITDFNVFPKHVELDTTIQYKKRIVLDYNQNMFSFDFAALNFTNPEKNQYAYRMEGLIDDWIQIGNERTASFTNLDPGEYVFHVKGSNNHGVWNEEGTSIKVIILPPWWRTTWAYLAYIILILSLLYALRQYDLRRQRLKHQLALEHEHAEKLLEIDHMKSRFFANISHEFRTPLTLILGPIKKWLPRLQDRNLKYDLQMMQRSANRLFRLINQLLDLSRLESGGMTLQVHEENIVQMLRGYVQSFESMARIKKINLEFKSEHETINAFVDRDKIEKIMYNLLSNAFKFTPENGRICISITHPPQSPLDRGEANLSPLKKGDKGGCLEIAASPPVSGTRNDNSQFPVPNSDFVEITVTNTGSYIPPEKIDRIFDRFYQANDSANLDHEGSGIGLALTRELAELHHGRISVASSIDTGTTFTVILPIGTKHLNNQDISTLPSVSTDPYVDPILYEADAAISHKPTYRKKMPRILVIEDNADVRFYIRGHLESDFRIIEASDGKEGLQTAIESIPDLIISDVMMPGTDGFELCEKLKTDERTSHIPVILLTARATTKDKIDGLETGADDYLTKPFDANELQARIRNLLKQREKLREYYARHYQFDQQAQAGNKANHAFHDRAVQVVAGHLGDEKFTVLNFAGEMDYSRSQLTRKLEALTGMSASHFIRMQRLVKAKEMLDHHEVNVSQVAYACGFNNLSYFSRSFKAQFGQLPSEYIKNKL